MQDAKVPDFFPNSDTHPGRRQRIIRALEYGATWQPEFNGIVTHIITDREYDYPQLLKYLKISELPVSHTSLSARIGQ
jgi:DNA polymerase IV